MSDPTKQSSLPQIKFFKDAAPKILSGEKTVEARPRSPVWIARLQKAETVELTYGPRFKPPTVFALAKIQKIDIKPFSDATLNEIRQFGSKVQSVDEFAKKMNEWYAKELSKDYPVVWIYFEIIESLDK